MPTLEEIDPNMKNAPLENGLHFTDARSTPARFYGLVEGEYARLPENVRAQANEAQRILQTNTSGGRVRFVTDSKRVGVRTRVTDTGGIPNFTYIGYAGIDCYTSAGLDYRFRGVCCPPLGGAKGESSFRLSGKPELVTLYLPLYDGLESFEIGLEPGASLEAPPPYTHETPIVYYGSSITQGGCAGRAGNNYCALASRWLDSDFTCLGFSGNAKGEPWMAKHIAGLPMSCFVFDYDHNAPDPAYLRETHRPFLEIILSRRPELPVIMLSKPNPDLSGPDFERREIIRDTYEWAKSQGARAWFVDGESLFGGKGYECCTVDGDHPNDLGFFRMAETVYPILREALEG